MGSPGSQWRSQSGAITIAVVGDVHDQWESADADALRHLGVDLLLLVGDFGNESIEIVRSIANVEIPKAVILGNHDAWYSASEWGISKSPYNHAVEDRVQQQLDLLGVTHVGYGKLDFPALQLTVVGSRPFSWGGPIWKNSEFYHRRYGVNNFADSTAQIVQAAASAMHDTVIFIGHCGPLGLGERPEDPCGKDWQPIGGDHGDPDFAAAIDQTRQIGKHIPLVTFGHMHHRLRHRQDLQRVSFVQDSKGTAYLNAACVPRIVDTAQGRRRNFSLVTLQDSQLIDVALVWVDRDAQIVTEQYLYQRSHPVSQPVSN
jgi:uncharacterized protein (TIGR04168 family)